MSSPWTDLLSGARAVSVGPELSGQWVLTSTQRGARIDGVDAAFGDRLLADSRHGWTFSAVGLETIVGTVAPLQPPATADSDALLRMQESLRDLYSLDATWKDWSEQSPLAPKIAEHIRIRPFDTLLEERLVFLEEVCRSPRSHLRIDLDLEPITRARRVARQAIVRLASHREDWDRPTVLGVRPKRVLCLVPEEEYDLYENRLAARLVDHIRTYLANRLARLGNVLRMMGEADFSKGTQSVNWRQRHRLFVIWGEAIKDDSAPRIALATQQRLDALYLRTLALLDSPLYRAVPRSAHVTGLRYTNILLNDSNYRQVAWLWKAWAHEGIERPLTAEARYLRDQQVFRGMTLFTRVVVARALARLGLTPRADSRSAIPNGAFEIHLESPAFDASLSSDQFGVLTVRSSKATVRIVAIASSLHTEDSEAGQSLPKRIEHSCTSDSSDSVLIVHLPNPLFSLDVPESVSGSSLQPVVARWNPQQVVPQRVAALSISPWNISSVERMARFLRWQLYIPLLESYPPSMKLATLPAIGRHDWLQASDDKTCWLIPRLPSDRESTIDELVKAVETETHRTLTARGGRAAQNARMDAKEFATGVAEQFQSAKSLLNRMQCCPVCGESDGVITPLDRAGRSVRVLCDSCESSWGIYACGGRLAEGRSCGARVPFIQLAGIDGGLQAAAIDTPNWAEALLGADVLSIPSRDHAGGTQWRCGSCAEDVP